MGSRVLGVDVGRRRVGLAISDSTRTLARPLTTLTVTDTDIVDRLVAQFAALAAEDEGLSAIVIGVPVHLDGSPHAETDRVVRLIEALRARTAIPLVEADERLSSREAESRLALRERDWKVRKARLDAAAAAVILQDYLDGGRGQPSGDIN
jgi:putative Holliday junction resolvase